MPACVQACQEAGWCTVVLQSFHCIQPGTAGTARPLPRYRHADVHVEWEAVIAAANMEPAAEAFDEAAVADAGA